MSRICEGKGEMSDEFFYLYRFYRLIRGKFGLEEKLK